MDEPQRIPIRHPGKQPADGVLNIRRDVQLAREAYGPNVPKLGPAIAKARMAQIADNVEELDGHLLDLILAAEDVLTRIRTAFPELTTRHSA